MQSGMFQALSRWFEPSSAQLAVDAHAQALRRHGHFADWQQALLALPPVAPGWSVRDGWLHAGGTAPDPDALRAQLRGFIPWRKGPLVLGGVDVSTEWRSDFKWRRMADHVNLDGARVLDVGAGNGYFGWRMLESGAAHVLGCDPTPLFAVQHAVIRHFTGSAEHELLALRLEDLPPGLKEFDLVFSMGVLYHRREPIQHLVQLRERLRSGGGLVLETLIVPNDDSVVLEPTDRYARMRNVHALPSLPRLLEWLAAAGFGDARCVDISVTTPDEQRTTDWMPFHSLAEALDPADECLTVEGLPRPRRAVLLAGV